MTNQIAIWLTIALIVVCCLIPFVYYTLIPWWKRRKEYKRKCREYEERLGKWGENVMKAIQNTPGGRLKEEKYRGG